jgi:hypothetical protein
MGAITAPAGAAEAPISISAIWHAGHCAEREDASAFYNRL